MFCATRRDFALKPCYCMPMPFPPVASPETRHVSTEAAADALQEATLLTDLLLEDTHVLRRDDLTMLQAALGRAIAALQPHPGRDGSREVRDACYTSHTLTRS